MINYKRSNDIRHGIILKESGEPEVGIFHGSALPSILDDGGIPSGSIYIRSNGELHQKNGLLNTNWSLVGSGSTGGTGTADTTSASAIFTRDDTVTPQTWLKIGGKISSDKSGWIVDNNYTRMSISVSNKIITNGDIDILVNATSPFVPINTITLTNQRTNNTPVFNLTQPLVVGDEISCKTNTGSFEDIVLFIRLLE